MIYAFDTNTVSYLIKGNEAGENIAKNYHLHESQGDDIIIPPIVYYEIKRGLLKINSIKKAELFDELFFQFGETEFTFEIWNTAAEIYVDLQKRGLMIDEIDILIGAFCIVNDYTLVTHNTAHFERIDGLEYVDWTI